MNDLPGAFEELDKEIQKIILKSEREVSKTYKGILETLRTTIRKLYDKYERSGKLSFDTMGKYDRLPKLEDEVEKSLSLLYKENSNITKATLNQIFVTTMSQTVDILENALTGKTKSLIPIKKMLNIDQTVNERMNGLYWAERMGKHRGDVIWNVNKTLKEGLAKGSTYREMSNRLKTELEGNVLQPMRIVRTEAGRVYAKTQEETLNKVADEGIKMTKTWRTSKDERVRSKHQAMEGVTVPYEEDFVLPDGKTTKMPRLSGYAAHDIHCRCFVTIDLAEEAREKLTPKFKTSKDEFPEYEEKEIAEMSKKANTLVNKYTDNNSKWSGNTIILPDHTLRSGGKDWNCDMSVKRRTDMHVLIHEHLHAHSISYYDKMTYIKYAKMEETSVELMAKLITEKEGFKVYASCYDEMVEKLLDFQEKICPEIGLQSFASELFHVPLPEREAFLEQKLEQKIGVLSIGELEYNYSLIEQLRGR